jgi:hypothetical protein
VSIEAHPIIHAAGLTVDVVNAVEARLRGRAAKRKPKAVGLCMPMIAEFVVNLSILLDKEYDRDDHDQ